VVHLVDTIEVEPERVEDYLAAVRTRGLAGMTDAGAVFVSCATTASDLGERVSIQVVWGFDDHEQWNDIRRCLVLDPRWYEYARIIAALRTGGTRRFYAPVPVRPT